MDTLAEGWCGLRLRGERFCCVLEMLVVKGGSGGCGPDFGHPYDEELAVSGLFHLQP